MKITAVRANNRKKAFEVETRKGTYPFPYSLCDPAPSPGDRIVEVGADSELGREAFTYVLESGGEGTVHFDAVLESNEDPSYLADMTLYRLTTDARARFDESPFSAREVARRLGTSPAQLYRLLDPTNYSKSIRQLLSLLYVLGLEVDVEVRDRPQPAKRTAKRAAG